MASVGLLPALGIIAGSLCGLHAHVRLRPLLFVLPALCVAAGVSWYYGRGRLTVVALVLGFWTVAFVLASDARDRALHPSLRETLESEYGGFSIETLGPAERHDPIVTTVRLTEDAALRDEFASLRGVVTSVMLGGERRSVDGGVVLSIGGGELVSRVAGWRAGRTIEAPVVFRRPARYLNEGVPDFETDLAFSGTTLLGSVKSGLLVNVLQRGSVVGEASADVRAFVRRAINRWVGPRNAVSAAIVSAVLIGDRSGIPDEVRDRLQAAGTYHVIAISGGNIAVLVALAVGMSAIAGVRGRPAAIGSIASLLVYAQIVTGGPSVWRATLMALVHLAARVLDHRTPMWQAAAVAAGSMLILRPLDLQDPGFLLTFGATAALLEVARHAHLFPRNRVVRWVAMSLLASVAVEVALAPVGATTFSRVTSAGFVLNLLAVPLMGVVQAAGLVVTLSDAIGIGAALPGLAAHLAASAIVESARLVEVAPWLTRRVPSPGAALVLAYYAALIAALTTRDRMRLVATLALIAAIVAVSTGRGPGLWRRETPAGMRLTVFDVGQGESMVLESRGAGAMLIDAGGAPFGGEGLDIGGRVLAPAIWSRGVSSLETLLVTHADPDHLGGAEPLLDAFGPSGLWLGIQVPRHQPSQRLLQRAADSGVSVRERRAGDLLSLGPIRIRVLHPPPPDWERQRVRNDDSVVLEALYGDVALLLTGDISADVERAILPRLTPARIRVLKVAHHGSRTSSSQELLEAWRPQVAIISCGRGNTFGHPAPDVLRRLEAIGARVFRTDRQGQIAVETSGRAVRVTTFTGERHEFGEQK